MEFRSLGVVFDLFCLILAGSQWPLDGLVNSTPWAHIGIYVSLNAVKVIGQDSVLVCFLCDKDLVSRYCHRYCHARGSILRKLSYSQFGKASIPTFPRHGLLFSDNSRNFDCPSRSGDTDVVLARDLISRDITLV